MKISTFRNTIAFFVLSPSFICLANDVPSNSLQVEFQKKSLKQEEQYDLLSLTTVYQVPVATYQYLDEVLTSFYNTITFTTSITDSTFKTNSHYELVAIPLVAENNQGVNIELFGNFSDPSTKRLSNYSSDQVLYNYLSNTEQMNIYSSSLSVGAGISFNTSNTSKIKIIISNSEIPGYGNSNALLGFESKF
ncbi:hypothetical protein CW745_14075 [Psychromonas sp. psych-6C06]|uniref:hypothetical protein n=1 Tax=Psychromonas sp. psych-6C06 TaxID=2058089 RepID=UPI000C32E441|nr:hypothetical protein [Psychromonas sp. psych-6C06]PKF60654.1 hypothetical protein CW745_14075 [Psychromonas sp. psych-6C06]